MMANISKGLFIKAVNQILENQVKISQMFGLLPAESQFVNALDELIESVEGVFTG